MNEKIIMISLVIFLAVCSCDKTEKSLSLYKGQLPKEALRFLGVPEERLEKELVCFDPIKKRRFVEDKYLNFAEKLVNVSTVDDYKRLLCNESLEQIKNVPRVQNELERFKTSIKNGEFPVYRDYKRFLATIRLFEDSDLHAVEELAVRPTDVITTWHYLQSKKEDGDGMLCGTQFYLISRDDKVKLVHRAVSEYGIEAEQIGTDFKRIKSIVEKFGADSSRIFPETLKDLLSQENDKEFVERSISNFEYTGHGKSLKKDAGAVMLYYYTKSGFIVAIKLGDKTTWNLKEHELPKHKESSR